MKQRGFIEIVILIVILVAAAIGGAYYLGRTTSQPQPSPSPTAMQDESANWEMYTSTQLPNNLLKSYSIQYPTLWDLDVKRDDISDTLTLIKEGYMIKIYQSAYGGGGCIFEGEIPEGPVEDLRDKKYVQIESGVGTLRRFTMDPSRTSNPDTTTVFDFCGDIGNEFINPTLVGDINYTVPKDHNEAVLREMDNILETLKEAK